MKVLCLLFDSSSPLSALAEVCLYWTPHIAVSHEAIFLEIGKSRHLYTEEVVLAGLQEMLASFEVQANLAVGEDLPTALAFARYQCTTKSRLPIHAITDYWDPFHSGTAVDNMLAALKQLGIRTIEDFLKFPAPTWGSRFGTPGLFIAQRANDATSLLWPLFTKQEHIVEAFDIDESHAIQNLEPLLFMLKKLLDRLMVRLRGRDERMGTLEFVIKQEPYSTIREPVRRWIIDFPLPQSNPQTILAIMRERLHRTLNTEPLESPVVFLSLQALETSPWHGSQTNLFSRQEDVHEAWTSLIARITERVGKGTSFLASPIEHYCPERAWQKTMKLPSTVSLPFPKRPLRLLRHPERIKKSYSSIVCRTTQWNIIETDGPEHLCGEWWDHSFDRNYYTIHTYTGERLWIFQIPGSNDYYLHGYFD